MRVVATERTLRCIALVDRPTQCRSRRVALLLTASLCVVASPALADDEPTEGAEDVELALPFVEPEVAVQPPAVADPNRHWQPHWERFSAADGFVIAVAEGAAWAVYLAEPVTEVRWYDRLPGDDSLRAALMLPTQSGRDLAATISDAMFFAMLVWPPLVDAVLMAGVWRGDEDTALQMALLDAEVFAVGQMIAWLTSRLVGRVRPEALECAPAGTCVDRGSGPVDSFVGGHTIMGYASAGLTCVHHMENPWIMGSISNAGAMCGASLAVATAIAVLRLNADRHWASDEGFGALMGAALGFGLPYLLRYARPRTLPDMGGVRLSVMPGAGGAEAGMTVRGSF